MRTEVYGRLSRETVQTLHDMGSFYLRSSQWEKSITVFEDIVMNWRALSGQDDLSVAECVSALARLYAHVGMFSYANACLAEMKRIRCACAEDCTDKETCDSHLSTGIVLRAQGNIHDSSLEFGLAVRDIHTMIRNNYISVRMRGRDTIMCRCARLPSTLMPRR